MMKMKSVNTCSSSSSFSPLLRLLLACCVSTVLLLVTSLLLVIVQVSTVNASSLITAPMQNQRFFPFALQAQQEKVNNKNNNNNDKKSSSSFAISNGATVAIEDGCVAGEDFLEFHYQGSYNIDARYDVGTCVLYLFGDAPFSEYRAAITSSVTFFTNSPIDVAVASSSSSGTTRRRFTWTFGARTFFNTKTGNFYTINPKFGVGFEQAVESCKMPLQVGKVSLTGYLATVTSQAELDGIRNKINSSAAPGAGGGEDRTFSRGMWIALRRAADTAENKANLTNPDWTWQAGPEKDLVFWHGWTASEGGNKMIMIKYQQEQKDHKYAPINEHESSSFNMFTGWSVLEPRRNSPSSSSSSYPPTGLDRKSVVVTRDGFSSFADTEAALGYVCEYDSVFSVSSDWAVEEMKTWYKSVDVISSCSSATAQADCVKLSKSPLMCWWSSSESKCSPAPGSCASSSSLSSQQGEVATSFDMCLNQPGCSWDYKNQICSYASICSMYGSSGVCEADPACMMQGGGLCVQVQSCSDFLTAGSCTSAAPKHLECQWTNGLCLTSASSACSSNAVDVEFLIDASATMSGRFGEFPDGFAGLINALNNSDFGLTRTPAGVTPAQYIAGRRVGFVGFNSGVSPTSSANLTGSPSGVHKQLSDLAAWRKMQTPDEIEGCNLGPALEIAAQKFAGPSSAGRKKIVVIVSSRLISDAGAIRQKVSSMMSSDGIQFIGFIFKPLPTLTRDSLSAFSVLKPLIMSMNNNNNVFFSGALGGGANPLTASSITKIIRETIVNGYCSPKMPEMMMAVGFSPSSPSLMDFCVNRNSTNCNNYPNCEWDSDAQVCAPSHCVQHSNVMTCLIDPTCAWDAAGSLCKSKCPGYVAAVMCASSVFCSWDSTKMQCVSQPCFNAPNEAACAAMKQQHNCVYNASNAIRCTPQRCVGYTSAQDCKLQAVSGCEWSSNRGMCFYDPCRAHSANINMCMMNPQCTVADGWCKLVPCAAHNLDQNSCQQDFNCEWSTEMSPPVCLPAPCTAYNNEPATAKQNCMTRPGQCLWQPLGFAPDSPGRCITFQCRYATKACDCAKMSEMCTWQGGECVNSDSALVCPTADLIFAIEGSAQMSNPQPPTSPLFASGRIQNGFASVINSLSQWADTIPFGFNWTDSTGQPTTPAQEANPPLLQSGSNLRVAVSAFGPAKNGFFVRPGIGAGNDFAHGHFDLLGPGMMLSDLLKTQSRDAPIYAVNDNALLPAVRNARRIFERTRKQQIESQTKMNPPSAGSSSPPPKVRQQVLVMIQANPGTDGRNPQDVMELAEEYDLLRKMNVAVLSVSILPEHVAPLPFSSSSTMSMRINSGVLAVETTLTNLQKDVFRAICDPFSTSVGSFISSVAAIGAPSSTTTSFSSSPPVKSLQSQLDQQVNEANVPCVFFQDQHSCNAHSSHCLWNMSLRRSCPMAGECPNLDCMRLPHAVARKFECANCHFQSGKLACSRANVFPPPTGLCVPATQCTTACSQAACTSSGCAWMPSMNSCVRSACSGFTDIKTCGSNSGCVWDEATSGGGGGGFCRPSLELCSHQYSKQSCNGVAITQGMNFYEPCEWNADSSQPFCTERRCRLLSQASCALMVGKCQYDPSSVGAKCHEVTCTGASTEQACLASGVRCFWDAYKQYCEHARIDCQVSQFSDWSPCTDGCGITQDAWRERKIIAFPNPLSRGAQSCAQMVADDPMYPPADRVMFENQHCYNLISGWNQQCSNYCQKWKGTINDNATQHEWNKKMCLSKTGCLWRYFDDGHEGCDENPTRDVDALGCESIVSKNTCQSSPSCTWYSVTNRCYTASRLCSYANSDSCNKFGASWCQWRTGSNLQYVGKTTDSRRLFNPSAAFSEPFFVFGSSALPAKTAETDKTIIDGVSVVIESNFQREQDKLWVSLPIGNSVKISYSRDGSALFMTGNSSISRYITFLGQVKFYSTSVSLLPRAITYSLCGRNTVYSQMSQHCYFLGSASDVQNKKAGSGSGVTWNQARSACSSMTLRQQKGYLATITTAHENELVALKLASASNMMLQGSGSWIGGMNANGTNGTWRWAPGSPEGSSASWASFWTNGSSWLGGHPTMNQQTQAFAAFNGNIGEPLPVTSTPESQAVFIDVRSGGSWRAKSSLVDYSDSFVCEFGGDANQQNKLQLGGVVWVGVGGCVATPDGQCQSRLNSGNCSLDPSCAWDNSRKACSQANGCFTRSTPIECGADANCFWSTATEPGTCIPSPCASFGAVECNGHDGRSSSASSSPFSVYTTNSWMCRWDSARSRCVVKRDSCEAVQDPDTCNSMTCNWISESVSASVGVKGCFKKNCWALQTLEQCMQNPTCWFVDNLVCWPLGSHPKQRTTPAPTNFTFTTQTLTTHAPTTTTAQTTQPTVETTTSTSGAPTSSTTLHPNASSTTTNPSSSGFTTSSEGASTSSTTAAAASTQSPNVATSSSTTAAGPTTTPEPTYPKNTVIITIGKNFSDSDFKKKMAAILGVPESDITITNVTNGDTKERAVTFTGSDATTAYADALNLNSTQTATLGISSIAAAPTSGPLTTSAPNNNNNNAPGDNNLVIIACAAGGGAVFLVLVILVVYRYRKNNTNRSAVGEDSHQTFSQSAGMSYMSAEMEADVRSSTVDPDERQNSPLFSPTAGDAL